MVWQARATTPNLKRVCNARALAHALSSAAMQRASGSAVPPAATGTFGTCHRNCLTPGITRRLAAAVLLWHAAAVAGWIPTATLVNASASAPLMAPLEVAQLGPESGSRTSAAVSMDGHMALVGFPNNVNTPGTAVVFVSADPSQPPGGEWEVSATLAASDGVAGDNFGRAVCLRGTTALVGAWTDTSGAAYIWTLSSGNSSWVEGAKLVPNDGATAHGFGGAVAIDGVVAAVGAKDHDATGTDRGAVYVYMASDAGDLGGEWTQVARLLPPGSYTEDGFGGAIALSGCSVGACEEPTMLVGSAGDDNRGSNTGAARVYVAPGGPDGTWYYVDLLTASDAAWDDGFGCAVALDGTTGVIGSRADDDRGARSGSAYVFEANGGEPMSYWQQTAKLVPDDGGPDDYFGHSVALRGNTIVVGTRTGISVRSGLAYAFVRSLTDASDWIQVARLEASSPSVADRYGEVVAVSGSTIVRVLDRGGAQRVCCPVTLHCRPAHRADDQAGRRRHQQLRPRRLLSCARRHDSHSWRARRRRQGRQKWKRVRVRGSGPVTPARRVGAGGEVRAHGRRGG